jgi:uncharacterized protein YeaO (DUF488 family)
LTPLSNKNTSFHFSSSFSLLYIWIFDTMTIQKYIEVRVMVNIQMKRIYEAAEPSDGFRVLVDRLWPRGVRKDSAHIDLWAKDITPSTSLREDFHSGRDSWEVFSGKYRAELFSNPALDDFVNTIKDKKTVTLLFAGKDTVHTHVKVIIEALEQKLSA